MLCRQQHLGVFKEDKILGVWGKLVCFVHFTQLRKLQQAGPFHSVISDTDSYALGMLVGSPNERGRVTSKKDTKCIRKNTRVPWYQADMQGLNLHTVTSLLPRFYEGGGSCQRGSSSSGKHGTLREERSYKPLILALLPHLIQVLVWSHHWNI